MSYMVSSSAVPPVAPHTKYSLSQPVHSSEVPGDLKSPTNEIHSLAFALILVLSTVDSRHTLKTWCKPLDLEPLDAGKNHAGSFKKSCTSDRRTPNGAHACMNLSTSMQKVPSLNMLWTQSQVMIFTGSSIAFNLASARMPCLLSCKPKARCNSNCLLRPTCQPQPAPDRQSQCP